jgi:L-fuconolactonase
VIIDAHHHLWDPARADYPWLTDDFAPIRRAFTPDDLAPALAAAGVDGTVLVQTRSSLEETREFLATAAATPWIRGVVGWVDLTDDAVAEAIERLRDGPGGDRLVAIRHQAQDEPDPRWLLRPDVVRGIRAVADTGLAYDVLVRPRELPAAAELVRSMPDARFVVDHLAKPPIQTGDLQPWADLVRGFAGLDNTWWKISGLVTEADWERWRPADLAPFVELALEAVGPGRLIFGSDWPVCLVAATYAEVIAAARELTGSLTPSERAAIFGETARAVYRL